MQFIDLKAQYAAHKTEIDNAVSDVLASTRFINGPEVKELEEQLAEYLGVSHALTCSSGTDALLLGLMALDLQPKDEVIVPTYTFISTAETIALLGGTPVFADIKADTFNIDPEQIETLITDRTVGIIPVSLFGQPADIDSIEQVATRHGLWVFEDAAQSFGAEYKGKKSGALTKIAATSFFPAKPLGCYGDGGAVFTYDKELAERITMIRNHGQRKKYDYARVGINGRLDTVQAAVLQVKLRHFDEEMEQKRRVAGWYAELLDGLVSVPPVLSHNKSVWAQYTVRSKQRDHLQQVLKERDIPTAVYYPKSLHEQDAFRSTASDGTLLPPPSCPVAEQASRECFSLPMHSFLQKADVEYVADVIQKGTHEQ
ncbi:MAG: DegT/DnrJ/EryC1/StrS family aminotransferase [Spirochaetales bacterium]|nr:DegT/DnrJ/EryC1/StrS family aminotransferase [Spirochaetales bacterium]MCF7937756.1 DegT/DnrJ/EryC1/StrS family aminotransferase [Spirochaetales bacterium]